MTVRRKRRMKVATVSALTPLILGLGKFGWDNHTNSEEAAQRAFQDSTRAMLQTLTMAVMMQRPQQQFGPVDVRLVALSPSQLKDILAKQ